MKASSYIRLFALLTIALALIAFLFWLQRRTKPLPPRQPSELSPIGEILDGDTFVDSSGRRIRLAGIDTPETDEPLSREAAILLTDILSNASVISYDSLATDDYGRLIAIVEADGVPANGELLRQGLARVYYLRTVARSHPYLAEEFCALQQEARSQKVGIWGLPAPDPSDRYFGTRSSRTFHRPGCFHIRRSDTLRMLRLLSREEFLDSCYTPCRRCGP
jgi:endonuclease YncB( thermonuclease family)